MPPGRVHHQGCRRAGFGLSAANLTAVRRTRLVAAATALTTAGLAAVSCGAGTAAPGAQRVASAASANAQPISQPWPIAAVARTRDPRIVAVTITGVPVSSATGPCHADVSYEATEAALSVGIGITVASRLTNFGGCATGPRRLMVKLRSPLGRRDVFASDRVTPQGGRFIAVGHAYRECRPPSCNPQYQPVLPDCMHLRDAIGGTDMPAHFRFDGPCRPPFAAVVVDIGAGECPVSDASNPCAGKRLTRQFWYSDGGFWRLVLQGDKATCTDARHAFARFPAILCRDPQWTRAMHQ
jgi:hypothetical protein